MLMKRFYLLSAAAIMGAAVMSGAGGRKLADCAVFRPGHRSDVKQAEEPSRRYLRSPPRCRHRRYVAPGESYDV